MRIMNPSIFVVTAMSCMLLCPACAEGWETDGSVAPATDDETQDDDTTQEPETDTRSKIQLSTIDGQHSEELTASCNGFLCLSGETLDTHVDFVLPSGYRRHAFSKAIDPSLSAGGSAEWATQDPHDATIHLHAWADAISTCTVKVWEVTAIKD